MKMNLQWGQSYRRRFQPKNINVLAFLQWALLKKIDEISKKLSVLQSLRGGDLTRKALRLYFSSQSLGSND